MTNNLKNHGYFSAPFLSIRYVNKQVANRLNPIKNTWNKIINNSLLNLFNNTNQFDVRFTPIKTSYANITSQLLKTGRVNKVIYNIEEVIDEKQLLLQLNMGKVDNLKIKSEEDKQLCDAIKQYGESVIQYDNLVKNSGYTINEYLNSYKQKLIELNNIKSKCNYAQKTPAEIVESIQRVVQNECERLINEVREEYASHQPNQLRT